MGRWEDAWLPPSCEQPRPHPYPNSSRATCQSGVAFCRKDQVLGKACDGGHLGALMQRISVPKGGLGLKLLLKASPLLP